MTDLQALQARLAEIQAKIDEAKKVQKIEKKLHSMKLNHRTSHKYFDLQAAYMQAIRS